MKIRNELIEIAESKETARRKGGRIGAAQNWEETMNTEFVETYKMKMLIVGLERE